jgi:hypothetical protein
MPRARRPARAQPRHGALHVRQRSSHRRRTDGAIETASMKKPGAVSRPGAHFVSFNLPNSLIWG